MKASLIQIVVIFAFLLILPNFVLPQTIWYVDDDNTSGPWDGSMEHPFQFIQDGINAASNGDTLLVMAGTYVENIDFLGKAITVKSSEGPDGTTIDGSQAGSVVSFVSGEGVNSVLDGFKITNGLAPRGGGIQCTLSSPRITNNIIIENTAYYPHGWRSNGWGGGIYCFRSSAEITNNSIMKNTAFIHGAFSGGGGICCSQSSPTITNNSFIENSAIHGGGIYCDFWHCGRAKITKNSFIKNSASGDGGGICSSSSPTITRNSFIENSAGRGGGIYCYSSSSEIRTNSIIRNTASSGGGIATYSDARVKIRNNIITENSASACGGGIYCNNSSCYGFSPVIVNNAVYGNSATQGGGIFCVYDGSPAITNNTIYGNSAVSGGGIYCIHWSSPAITNTILWNNIAQERPEIFITSSSNPTVTYCDIRGGWSSGTGNINADPLFIDAPNGDFHLRLVSPCVDSGSNDAPYLPDKDDEGDPRIVNGDLGGMTIVDIGADELLSEIAARFGNVNASGNALSNVLHVNGSRGDNRRVYSIFTGNSITMTMDASPAGPSPSNFSLYAVGWEPGIADIALQPGGIGVSCIPMPLSNGTALPPPYTLVNNIGYKNILGWPVLPWIGPAPCTILNLPFGLPKGTYTFQGYLLDNGAPGPGVSLTNAIVMKVQ